MIVLTEGRHRWHLDETRWNVLQLLTSPSEYRPQSPLESPHKNYNDGLCFHPRFFVSRLCLFFVCLFFCFLAWNDIVRLHLDESVCVCMHANKVHVLEADKQHDIHRQFFSDSHSWLLSPDSGVYPWFGENKARCPAASNGSLDWTHPGFFVQGILYWLQKLILVKWLTCFLHDTLRTYQMFGFHLYKLYVKMIHDDAAQVASQHGILSFSWGRHRPSPTESEVCNWN